MSHVDILINGQRLIDLAREVELPFATAEGRPEWAGEYQNLPVQSVISHQLSVISHQFN